MAEEQKVSLTREQVIAAYQQNEAQLNALQQRSAIAQELLRESENAKESLNDLKNSSNAKILVSLGSGVYIDAIIESGKTVKTAIGSNVMIDSSNEKAIAFLEKRIETLKKDLEALNIEQQKVVNMLNSLGQIIQTAEQQFAKQQNRQ